MRNSYDIIEIDNHVIFNTLQNFYFWEFYIFVNQAGLKHAETNIGKTFKTNIILITKYLIVKSSIFYQKNDRFYITIFKIVIGVRWMICAQLNP